MFRRLLLLVLAAASLLLVPLPAFAEPREVCGPHTAEDQVVRVFARGAQESALLCGSRYYGFRRIDWRVVSLDAIARTLASPTPPVYDERSHTWIHTGEVVVVLAAGDGQVVTARPVAG